MKSSFSKVAASTSSFKCAAGPDSLESSPDECFLNEDE